MIEQVAGFRRHQQFPFIRSLWEAIGYVQIWGPRYLTVLARRDLGCSFMPWTQPTRPIRPTLGSYQCIACLPPSLLAPCQLDPATLDVYLSPDYLPKHTAASHAQVRQFRLRGPSHQFGCIMAQYHFQHELPEASLSKSGILGTLLDSAQGVRFMSGLEATFLHGLVRPYLLLVDDRSQMRQVGNCLAVPQATLALAHCLKACLSEGQKVCMEVVLQRCQELRTHAGNFRLAPTAKGHVVYQVHQGQDLQLGPAGVRPLPSPPPDIILPFRSFWISDEDRTLSLAVPPNVTLSAAFSGLKVEVPTDAVLALQPVPVVKPWPPARQQVPSAWIEVASLPEMDFVVGFSQLADTTLLAVVAEGTVFLLDRGADDLRWGLQSLVSCLQNLWDRPLDFSVWLDPLGMRLQSSHSSDTHVACAWRAPSTLRRCPVLTQRL